jgi:hypothetical protein
MADIVSRTYSFVDGMTAYGSHVDAEVENIVDVMNSLNAGTTVWERVYATHATSVPLIADVSGGSQNAAEFKSSAATKASISSTGVLTLVPTSNQIVLGTTRTVTLTAPTPASTSRVVTIPDLGAAYSVVGTEAAQTINGAKTFTDPITQNDTSNQIVLGVTNTTTISATAPSASRVVTIPDPGAAASFVMTEGTQTINGAKTLSDLRGTLGANLAAGSNKITGLAAGTANGDSVRFEQVVTSALTGFSASAGTITASDTILTAINKICANRIVGWTYAQTGTNFATTSTTFQTTNSSVAYTNKASGNVIFVIAGGNMSTTSSNRGKSALFADTTNLFTDSNATDAIFINNGAYETDAYTTLVARHAPADTSEHTYAVKVNSSGGVQNANWGNQQWIFVFEIGA